MAWGLSEFTLLIVHFTTKLARVAWELADEIRPIHQPLADVQNYQTISSFIRADGRG